MEDREEDKEYEPEVEIRPAWTIDMMILSSLHKIDERVGNSFIEVERGNVNEIITLKAELKEFYSRMKKWLNDDYNDFFSKVFKEIEDTLKKYGQYNVDGISPGDFFAVRKMLELLKNILYSEYGKFMKTITIRTEGDKANKAMFGAIK